MSNGGQICLLNSSKFRYQIVREILDVDMDEREAAFKALQYNVNALEAYQTLQQIYGNLITFCKNVVVSGGMCRLHMFWGHKTSSHNIAVRFFVSIRS